MLLLFFRLRMVRATSQNNTRTATIVAPVGRLVNHDMANPALIPAKLTTVESTIILRYLRVKSITMLAGMVSRAMIIITPAILMLSTIASPVNPTEIYLKRSTCLVKVRA